MKLPALPKLEEAVLDRTQGRPYSGPIEVGRVYAWEPDLPHARTLCRIVRVGDPPPPLRVEHATGVAIIKNGSESVVWTEKFPPDGAPPVWNNVSRFREAVVPTLYRPMNSRKRA